MRNLYIVLTALSLLPLAAKAGTAPAPWDASAQAPTTLIVPIGNDAAVMAHAAALLGAWKTMDSRMWPMQIRTENDHLIQTQEPTALGLFGVTITDTRASGVAVITVETSAYEGKVFLIGQQRRDASKRAHLLAYLLEQSSGATSPAPLPRSTVPPANAAATSKHDAPSFAPVLDQLRAQLDSDQYTAALATIDVLRAEVARQASVGQR